MSDTVFQTLLARRSIRKYSAQPVNPEQVRRLLEAAMAAPSGHNKQPWHFVIVTGRATLDRLAENHPYAKMLFQAPLCIVVCGEPQSEFWAQDCSAATMSILLAATEMGLGSVWMGVHPNPDLERLVREALAVPPAFTPFCLIAVGHPAEQREPRTQYGAEKVHSERW